MYLKVLSITLLTYSGVQYLDMLPTSTERLKQSQEYIWKYSVLPVNINLSDKRPQL